jgi:hypothetical protein
MCFFAGAIALAAIVPSIAGAQDALSPQQLEFFEDKIRPVLVENCYKCHGGDTEKIRGGLVLMSKAGVLEGGDSGAAIVAGKPEESLLIQALRYTDPNSGMPPDGKLPDSVIADFVTWVANGAADPRNEATDPTVRTRKWSDPYDYTEGRKHWAYQPMADANPPVVKNEQWAAVPIDQFIFATLDKNGMKPAAAADKRTLLRRATYDLTGLPPTIKEIEDFVADTSPTAYEKVVDRLLASPHYGERWGRHWLDVARYADSNGLDENIGFANAFRYRDYVIKSMNDDKPYDAFLTEQIAGDIMPDPKDDAQRFDRLTGTGFLVLGAKVLAEPDGDKMNIDIVDEQLDVIGKAFMGQTLGCARCHDHKFDPVSTRDYYAMAGILKSTEAMIHYNRVARWRERELVNEEAIAKRKNFETNLAQALKERDALTSKASESVQAAWRNDVAKYLLAAHDLGRSVPPREAEDYAASNLQFEDSRDAGEGIGVLFADGDVETPFVEWKVDVDEPGRHQLKLRLANLYDVPISIRINGEIKAESLNAPKSSRRRVNASDSRWLEFGTYDLRAGENSIQVEAESTFPFLDQFAVIPVDDQSDYQQRYSAVLERYGLESLVLDTWIEFLHESKRDGGSAFAVWHAFAGASGPLEEEAAGIIESLRAAYEKDDDEAVSPPTLALLTGLPPASLLDVAVRYQTLLSSIDLAYKDQITRVDQRETELQAELNQLEEDEESEENEAKKRKLAEALAGLSRTLPNADQEALRRVLHGAKGPFAIPNGELRFYDEETRVRLTALATTINDLETNAPPEIPFAMAVAEGKMTDLPVHIRGDHTNLAKESVPRGFAKVVDSIITPPEINQAQSGRLEFARWLTNDEHPLTARVMVNRIWQYHFGVGLVDSPNNFGIRGGKPSHPDLLDWLARRFIADDWSIKTMHKRIMLSSTYRMGNDYNAANAETDPENRLLWRMNRRRLEAEPIRDAIYAMGGQLDLTVGGGWDKSLSGGEYVRSMSEDYEKPRRAVYMPIIRNAIYPMFSAYDYADPSVPIGARPATVIAPQALFMMNSPLVLQQSEAFAKTILERGDLDDVGRVEAAYLKAYGRPPTDGECAKAIDFLDRMKTLWAEDRSNNADKNDSSAQVYAWKNYCHVVMASSEFIYVN